MPRVDGKTVVAVASGAIMLTVGVGSVYLPFFMDRDKLRGLNEEGEMPSAAKSELEELKRQMRAEEVAERRKRAAPGSMWKNMNDASGRGK